MSATDRAELMNGMLREGFERDVIAKACGVTTKNVDIAAVRRQKTKRRRAKVKRSWLFVGERQSTQFPSIAEEPWRWSYFVLSGREVEPDDVSREALATKANQTL